jgi:2-C-methyl-D-erythritol 4-phosphate cytidylyltransferase
MLKIITEELNLVAGCIIAGGTGERFGAAVPKQFFEVLGKPIIVYTMEQFNKNPHIDLFNVVCLFDYIDSVYTYAKQYSIKKLQKVIPGGNSFGESVKNGVYSLKEYCKNDDIFVMHMAVAPLVSNDIICDLVHICKKHGNAFSAVPSYMCMCEKTGDGFSDKYLDREKIYGLNTPQAVRYGKVLKLYQRAEREGYDLHSRTHLSTLMLDMSEKLYFSKSSPVNIKITTMEDVELLKAYLMMQKNNFI